MSTIDDATLKDTVDTYRQLGGNIRATAEAFGIARSTVRDRLKTATGRGIGSTVSADPLPIGQNLDGLSTLYRVENEDGKRVLQWVKSKREPSVADVVSIVAETMKGIKSPPLLSDPIPFANAQLLTAYIFADVHLGMYSWKEETGQDYDVDIASTLLKGAMQELVANAPSSQTGLILNVGDFFHSDNDENRTRRSGNVLDSDTRYAKVLRTGVELEVAAVHLALQKHPKVIVRNLQGNHDPYSALALTQSIAMYFHDEPRVLVDTTPSPFFFLRHGKVLIGATHGDMAKPADMAGIMAAKAPAVWGATTHRYIYMGHIHRKTRGSKSSDENGGAIWETFQTIAPRDAWGNSMGFNAGRSMQAITHDAETGEKFRWTADVKGPE